MMKAKQLLLVPALLIAMLCMATTCKEKPLPSADVDYQIYLTNKSASKIECKYTKANNTRSVVVGVMKREMVSTVGFEPGDPTKEVSVNFKLFNAATDPFIDTTLVLKHIVLESLVVKVEMTVNADMTLTIVEKQG